MLNAHCSSLVQHDKHPRLCMRNGLKVQCHLDKLVPASRDNDGVVGDGAEAHAGHPLSVAVWLANGVLALSQCVP